MINGVKSASGGDSPDNVERELRAAGASDR